MDSWATQQCKVHGALLLCSSLAAASQFSVLIGQKIQFTAYSIMVMTCVTRYAVTHKLSIFLYLALPQGQSHHSSVSQLLRARSTYPTLSTLCGRTRRKPTIFGRALTRVFPHEDWARFHLTGDSELRTLAVKGEWSDQYTTEAPHRSLFPTL